MLACIATLQRAYGSSGSLSPGETLAAIDGRTTRGRSQRASEFAEKRYEASDLRRRAALDRDRILRLGARPTGSRLLTADSEGQGRPRSRGALEQYTCLESTRIEASRRSVVGAMFLLREENKGTEIDALFQRFAERFPDDPAVLNDHARRLIETGKEPALALQKAQRAVALQPESPDAHETLARALFANQRPADALEAVSKRSSSSHRRS